MAEKRWRNWWRMTERPQDQRYASCPTCGKKQELEVGEKFRNHCASYATREEALEYSKTIYSYCDYLGAFPEGKSP